MAASARVPQVHSEEYRHQLAKDLRRVGATAGLLSLAAFLYYFRTGQVLLYGDAVAHIHIARRLFDSLTPGIRNLGSVWLPASHLLTAPLVVNDWMWRSGVGGSIVSMLSYVAGCVGMFRLVRQFGRRSGAWVATAVFALNANVLYMQSTAMAELLYLAALIWSAVYAAEFLNQIWTVPLDGRRLRSIAVKCAAALWLAMWTRYDGWFQTGATVVLLPILVITGSGRLTIGLTLKKVWRSTWPAWVLLAAAPAIWLGYNTVVFGNALEFWNGPYSARAIQQRTGKPGEMHPGYHDMRVAFIFFDKCAKEDLAQGHLGGVALALSVAGLAMALFRGRASWVVSLLWAPLLFYTLSIAYGGVPIFMPFWRPWGWYNVRYGMQLLPAMAVGMGLVAQWASFRFGEPNRRYFIYAVLVAVALLTVREWSLVPLTLQEARHNARTRMMFEAKLARQLGPFKGQRMMMYTSDYAGALQRAGIHERNVVNESNWQLWQKALRNPAAGAAVVVAIGDDPVAEAVRLHPGGLRRVSVFESEEKPRTIIYTSTIYASTHGDEVRR
ncbi:MAG: hypothetical protein ABI383_10495 [Acidobacteriaceae bacterium]